MSDAVFGLIMFGVAALFLIMLPIFFSKHEDKKDTTKENIQDEIIKLKEDIAHYEGYKEGYKEGGSDMLDKCFKKLCQDLVFMDLKSEIEIKQILYKSIMELREHEND